MFTHNKYSIIYNGVATIGGKDIIQKGIDTVIWYWADDEGRLHTKKLNNLIYFKDSPVNIIIVTALSRSIEDDE